MAIYAKVRQMRFRDGLSISEIARRTSLSRNTLKTRLQEPAQSEMQYARPTGPASLAPMPGDFGRHWRPIRGCPEKSSARSCDCSRNSRSKATSAATAKLRRSSGRGGPRRSSAEFVRRGPASAHQRCHQKSGFVEEGQGSFQARSAFFTRGQLTWSSAGFRLHRVPPPHARASVGSSPSRAGVGWYDPRGSSRQSGSE